MVPGMMKEWLKTNLPTLVVPVVHSYGCKRCWVSRQDKQARSSSKASNQNPKAFKEYCLRLSAVNNLLAFAKKREKNF